MAGVGILLLIGGAAERGGGIGRQIVIVIVVGSGAPASFSREGSRDFRGARSPPEFIAPRLGPGRPRSESALVEGILQALHALGAGWREQPPRHHPPRLREFDSPHATANPHVKLSRVVEGPGLQGKRPRLAAGSPGGTVGIGRRGRIGQQSLRRQHDPAVGEMESHIQIKPGDRHHRLTWQKSEAVADVGEAARCSRLREGGWGGGRLHGRAVGALERRRGPTHKRGRCLPGSRWGGMMIRNN